jgi:DNA-binding transcriptional ArsR family regulator
MVDKQEQLDLVFRALSDPTRRSMLETLRSGEQSIVDLADPFEMSLAGAAKHVQVLDRAGLISRRKKGRTHYCSLNEKALRDAFRWLEQYETFWNSRLDELEKVLAKKRKRGKK